MLEPRLRERYRQRCKMIGQLFSRHVLMDRYLAICKAGIPYGRYEIWASDCNSKQDMRNKYLRRFDQATDKFYFFSEMLGHDGYEARQI